jgi:hypothetical protein
MLCLVMGSAAAAGAQELKVAYPGTGVVTLSGQWRFHTSDAMAWADPTLDDTQWETIKADATWGAQTHPGHTGYAWYRRQIEIDHVTGPLSIRMTGVEDLYELYWNGVKFGGQGTMPPHASWRPVPQPAVYPMPAADADGTLKGVLAIRVWKSPLDSLAGNGVGGMEGAPRIGDSKVLADSLKLSFAARQERALPAILECAFLLVVGLFALATWARDLRKRIFLWLGLFLLSAAGYGMFAFSAPYQWFTLSTYQLYVQTISSFADISIWMILMTLFGLDRDRRWRRLTAVVMAFYLGAQGVDTVTLFFWAGAGPGIQLTDGITTAIYSALPLYMFVLLVAGLRRRRDFALLPLALSCVALQVFTTVNGALGQFKRFTHIDFQSMIAKAAIHIGENYTFAVRAQITAVMLIVLVWTVLREQARERRQQRLLAAEIKSAKEVQQVLVPEAMEAVEGFAISTLYWPAEEVGGDLFQILPGDEGDVTVVLADVSGKGLKAAMTVSLMVGAVRTLAEDGKNPIEILRGLNRRLMGRTDGGFTTCLVMHVAANGTVTLGNAGHLPPFLNGVEMPVSGSLPLGVAAEARFEESRFHLDENDEVTLYTDGVLEAQAKDGELFGFGRAAEMMRARPGVRAIAEAARAFGQQDDITVVQIVRVHAEDKRERMSVDVRMVELAEA